MNFIECYVYFIGRMERGPVKIGMSAAPEIRLKDLQTAYPYELSILAKYPGGEETEGRLHTIFRADKLSGEWFKRSKELVRLIEMISCGVGLETTIRKIFADEYPKRPGLDTPEKIIYASRGQWING